jgi:prepilin-type N-terminal cleavage/methylation domain-containing protein
MLSFRIPSASPTAIRHGAAPGFTMIELLIALVIISMLAGVSLAGFNLLRDRARRTQSLGTITIIEMAMVDYRQEDPQRRFPTADPDDLFRADRDAAIPMKAGSLINRGSQDLGLRPYIDDPQDARHRLLVDAWGRPFRYRIDGVHDKTATKPAELADWNARGADTFAYVWSLGSPRRGTSSNLSAADADANAGNAAHWIHASTIPDSAP